MPQASQMAMAASALSALNRPGIDTVTGSDQLGVRTIIWMRPSRELMPSAQTSAPPAPAGAPPAPCPVAEKVTVRPQRVARSRMASALSESRFTTATHAWSKMRSLLSK